MSTRRVYTNQGSAESRVRQSLEQALAAELAIDTREDAAEAMIAAGLSTRVVAYGREVDKLLDQLAGACVSQARHLAAERNKIHQAAADHQADRLASAPRVSGLIRGPVLS